MMIMIVEIIIYDKNNRDKHIDIIIMKRLILTKLGLLDIFSFKIIYIYI